jgi:tetratricopeptide (TPR) repeat protein
MPRREKRSPPERASTESLLADLHRLVRERGAGSEEELNALMREVMSTGLGSVLPQTPLEQAQDLVYDAMEATSPKRRVALARQALELSRDCADAYVLLAEETDSVAEARVLLTDAVSAGARAIGDELESLISQGAMWLALETRPYLRALAALAALEWETGDRRVAIARGWELLRVNPNDNQGMRYVQLMRLLQAGSLEELERLLSAYPDEGTAAWTFGRALHLYRSTGPGPDADAALRVAKRANRHVVAYLLGEREVPAELPDYMGFGDETEAQAYAADAVIVWADAPGALDWIDSKRGPSGASRAKRRR